MTPERKLELLRQAAVKERERTLHMLNVARDFIAKLGEMLGSNTMLAYQKYAGERDGLEPHYEEEVKDEPVNGATQAGDAVHRPHHDGERAPKAP